MGMNQLVYVKYIHDIKVHWYYGMYVRMEIHRTFFCISSFTCFFHHSFGAKSAHFVSDQWKTFLFSSYATVLLSGWRANMYNYMHRHQSEVFHWMKQNKKNQQHYPVPAWNDHKLNLNWKTKTEEESIDQIGSGETFRCVNTWRMVEILWEMHALL